MWKFVAGLVETCKRYIASLREIWGNFRVTYAIFSRDFCKNLGHISEKFKTIRRKYEENSWRFEGSTKGYLKNFEEIWENIQKNSEDASTLIIVNTCFLKYAISSGTMVSAFAIIGIIFTLSCSLCMNSTSNGFRPWPDGAIKYKQQCTRVSEIGFLFTRLSAFKYSSDLQQKNQTYYFNFRKTSFSLWKSGKNSAKNMHMGVL